jgi:pterin-4a-carbinolamine dehydratase
MNRMSIAQEIWQVNNFERTIKSRFPQIATRVRNEFKEFQVSLGYVNGRGESTNNTKHVKYPTLIIHLDFDTRIEINTHRIRTIGNQDYPAIRRFESEQMTDSSDDLLLLLDYIQQVLDKQDLSV